MPVSTTDPRGLLDVSAAALQLGVTERWVRRAVADRRLPHLKIGHYVRFDADELAAYIEQQRVPAAGDAA